MEDMTANGLYQESIDRILATPRPSSKERPQADTVGPGQAVSDWALVRFGKR